MQQPDVPIQTPSLVDKTPDEIIAHFSSYGFTDAKGHDLILCQDFIDLISAVSSHKSST